MLPALFVRNAATLLQQRKPPCICYAATVLQQREPLASAMLQQCCSKGNPYTPHISAAIAFNCKHICLVRGILWFS